MHLSCFAVAALDLPVISRRAAPWQFGHEIICMDCFAPGGRTRGSRVRQQADWQSRTPSLRAKRSNRGKRGALAIDNMKCLP